MTALRPFELMERFITETMAMSHIYQPLMLTTLLANGGSAPARMIAAAFLAADQSQLDYYEMIANRYPRATLRKHGLVMKSGAVYRLAEVFDDLTEAERSHLISLCQSRIDAFLERRGSAPWSHRAGALDPIPGRMWFQVIERARRRCEACGVSSEHRALHVDHIVPRSRGGSNHEDNLQALCVTCNLQKGNRSQTDFRQVEANYAARDPHCPICRTLERVSPDALAAVVEETPAGVVLAPLRHVRSYFELGQAEVNALRRLEVEVAGEANDLSEVRIPLNRSLPHCHVVIVRAASALNAPRDPT